MSEGSGVVFKIGTGVLPELANDVDLELPSMDDKLKQVLLRLVEEIHDLRANLIVISGHDALHTSVDNAQAAKDSAIEKLRPDYEQFRKEIESLF